MLEGWADKHRFDGLERLLSNIGIFGKRFVIQWTTSFAARGRASKMKSTNLCVPESKGFRSLGLVGNRRAAFGTRPALLLRLSQEWCRDWNARCQDSVIALCGIICDHGKRGWGICW